MTTWRRATSSANSGDGRFSPTMRLSMRRVSPMRMASEMRAGAFERLQLLQRLGISDADVVYLGQRLAADESLRGDRGAWWPSRSPLRHSRSERLRAAEENKGGAALVGREVDVAAAHGQAVRSRARWAGRRPRRGRSRSLTILRMTTQLLGVLLAEVGPVGLDDVEELGTTVATPRKWPGRSAPSSARVTPFDIDPGIEARRVHLVGGGHEDDVDVFSCWSRRQVALGVARVASRSPPWGRTGWG